MLNLKNLKAAYTLLTSKEASKVDNTHEVIAAANVVATPASTNTIAGVNVDMTVLTPEELVAAGMALQKKLDNEAEASLHKEAQAIANKRKQELLKVTNALAASKRHLASVTASAAKAKEELLFQKVDLEDECSASDEQLRLSKEIAAASDAMTLEDARILLAERRAQQAAQGNTASQKQSYTNNGDSNHQTGDKAPKRPVAHAALVAAGLSDARAKVVLDKTYFNQGKELDSYVEYLIGNGEQAFVHQVAAIMCGDQGAYANRWKKHLAGAPATSSTTTPPVSCTAPAGADTTTPSTEGTSIDIPSGVDDTENDL